MLIRDRLPGDPDDYEARYIEAAVKGSSSPASICRTAIRSRGRNSITSSPGSNGCGARREILKQDIPVVLAGDYNVAPTALDIYPTRVVGQGCLDAAEKPRGVQVADRARLDRRHPQDHPSKPMFTFWDYKRNRWPRDAGLRLDHLLLSPALAPRLTKAGVDRSARRRRRQRPCPGMDRVAVGLHCATTLLRMKQ